MERPTRQGKADDASGQWPKQGIDCGAGRGRGNKARHM